MIEDTPKMKERREAYVEVLTILKHMDGQYVAQIPKDLIKFLEYNCSKEYEFDFDPSIPLENYDLKISTLNLLAMLNINYWCKDEVHKQELLKKYKKNEEKYKEGMNQKYNVDDLFQKKKDMIISEKTNNTLQEYHESKWFQRLYKNILQRIRRIFNK